MPRPATVAEAAALLREQRGAVRPTGTGSRLSWATGPDPGGGQVTELETGGLDRIVEHNPGDFTAVLEAGVPLAAAQARFAEAGQWLAVDPPGGGTIGGLVATADSGPARHRYGGVRDLVIGITVVLGDGTVARSGGKVIKNVAGYDLAKLFTGSYGTLGLIASVTVRLHPLASATATVLATSGEPARLAAAAGEVARRPLEPACLDVGWSDGRGRLLVRFSGAAARPRAQALAATLGGLDEVRVEVDDLALWQAQRAGQRSTGGAVVKVSGRRSDLPAVIAAAQECGASLVCRAGLGLSWLALPASGDLGARVAGLRRRLHPRPTVVLDGAGRTEHPQATVEPGALRVMARLKARFDPAGTFRPGVFVGGI
jgi:glycolate dehydrogenase FAD-binding subunit